MISLRGLLLAAITCIGSIHAALVHELPKEIIADGQWIISDMDGTLIGAPGYKKEPTLNESPAKEAIFNWIRAGGHLLVTTGGETQRTHERFSQFFPKDMEQALLEKRLLIATNGGAVISYFDGTRWTEDLNYQNSALATRIALSKENENLILGNAVITINDFYKTLRNNPSIIPDHLKKKYEAINTIANSGHPADFTAEELITLNSDIVPRIEIRRSETNEVVQICIIGIPADLNYDDSKLNLGSFDDLDKCKVGVTIEINFKGVDKALPVRWLEKGQVGYPLLIGEKSVAIGDRPNHNDAPLTTAVQRFVSVCEYDNANYIPAHVNRKIGHNELGSKLLFEGLLLKANEFNVNHIAEPVIPNTLDEVVKECIHSFQ